MKPIMARQMPDNSFDFFLADSTNKHTGKWMPEEEFLAEFERRNPEKAMKRCADPRCNRAFNPLRDDQRYCEARCNDRHRKRMEYRLSIGDTTEDEPVIVYDEPTKPMQRLREAMERARLEAAQRGIGTPRIRARAIPMQPFDWFLRQLKEIDYVYTGDFWKDNILALYDVWEANGRKLPPIVEIEKYVNKEGRAMRIAERDAAHPIDKEAQRRCAQLYPNMDRVNADGSLKP